MVRKFVSRNGGKRQLLALCFVICSLFSFSQNPIVAENALAGAPKSEWDISGAGDLSIQGFATDISVNKGQTVRFKINAGNGTAYTIKIYRLGWYNGNGARLVANLGSFTGVTQTGTSTNTGTGLVDCAAWSESATWAVPSTAVSGLYIARLTKTSGGGASHITFIVRDDSRVSDMLFKTSDATWQAYNPYGGASLYVGATSYPNGHAVKVSYNRPFLTRNGGGGGGAGEDWFMNAEYPMIRFLERNGYDVSYTTDVDMDRDATPITPAKHKILLSVGHDEYWSLNERNKFEAARNAGVHLAFFSGNEVYWKTRWENNYRTLVCYKEGTLGENVCGNKCDPTSAWTGLWRDGGNWDAGKPENALVGQISWELVTTSITVPTAYKNLRFWRNTSIATANSTTTLPNGTLGYEAAFEQYFDYYPSGRITLSSSNVNGKTHKLSLYRHPSGALVFGAGTVQWSWGLDNIHDRGSAAPSTAMQQATVNLFADMGVQPATLMSGLTAATASTDFTAPVCTITSPAHGATIPVGSNTTITGTASDAGGQLVGVEVSIDGGVTWKAATGTTNWSFTVNPSAAGSVNIRVRGFDDSGNMGVPGANGSASNITVTAGSGGGGDPTPACPCTIFPVTATPANANDYDAQPIEVGMKFRSSQAGYITAIRFYKGSNNTGTHTGHLWTSTGTKIAEVVFTNETASGWQQMLLPTPVQITANTTYVVSYHSSSGYYASTNPYFTSAVTNGPVKGLANGEDGPNGVYIYSAAGAFPTNNWQSSNYFVDVVFATSTAPDTTPPAVSISSPSAGNVSGTINVNANATDNVGVVGVQFKLDGVNLGAEDLTSPYSVSWNTTTVSNGSHTLTAVARDAAGNTATSSSVIVNVNNIVDTEGPVVSVTAPAAGATVSATVNVTANATDNVGVVGVQFKLDGVNLDSEDVSSPYSVSWNTTTISNGNHTLTAVARDAAGNTTTSAPVTVTVFNNYLVLALGFNEGTGTTANDNSGNNNHGTLTNGPTWTTSGRFGSAVVFDGSNDFVNIPDANSLDLTNGMTLEAWVYPTNLTGLKTIICKDRGTNNYTYTLAANNDASNANNQRPSSRLYNGSARTVTGTSKLALNTWTHVASTYDGTTFRLFINGVQVATLATTGNITVTTNPLRIGGTTALSGQYFAGRIDEVRIYNRALTASEIQTDMNTPIAPDLTAPTVNITAPAAGPVLGTVNVTADATDNIGVVGVQFQLDGVNLGAEDLTAPYSVSWNTLTATNGTHTLTAIARDLAGNITTSSSIVVTVNNDLTPPSVNITSPLAGSVNGTINVQASATDNVGVVGVQFLLDGINLGSEDLVAPYNVSWNTLTASEGTHTLTAQARDAAGNVTTSVAVEVLVDNIPPDTQAPTSVITSPVAGEVSGTININATATDNVGVVGVQFLLNGANLGAEDLSAPYTVSWNTLDVANGTYTLTARARDEAGNVTVSAGVVVNVNNVPDTQGPVVTITGPSAGTITGTVNVSATATDNVGVVGVQFLLNGANLGAEDLSAPYSVSWNTTTVLNGTYTLSARARDAAGNITTSPVVTVTVSNATNLVVSLNLNEGTGTAAGDISGNNHNGTLVNGPTWGAGKYGEGVNLDGSNDYINIPDHADFTLDPAQSYTWSVWLKPNSFKEWSTVWSQTLDAGNFFYFYAHTSSDPDGGPVTNGISCYWWVNWGSAKIGVHSTNNVLTLGQWSHVAITYNAANSQANRFTIYVNGVNVTATNDIASTGTITAINPTNIRVGSNQPYGEYINGSVDDVRFYKRLLTATEILYDMNTPVPGVILPIITPVDGATNVATNTAVTTVFNVSMDASTINTSTIELRTSAGALVPATVSYNATTRTATLTPTSALSAISVYTVTVKGGESGVKDATGTPLNGDKVSSFTTSEPPLITMNEGPGGPILVVSSGANPFSRYTLEILRAEGLNHFAAADIASLSPALLSNYDVVILGEMTVTSPHVTMLTDWVNAGGTLIAFKPASLLNTLFGISASSGTLADKYLLVNTSSGPGAGIVNQTIQFHGTANLHTLNGATSLATLFSSATTATSNPAVTYRSVGTNGGAAIAFTYDLPRSIVYTRQGNPAWVGQKRDGQEGPIRSDDLYFGLPAGTGADWIDFNKVAIPQADEQQRLLANIILQSNLHRKPLPRFWYLPRDLKAVVMMTGDDHFNGATPGRFNQYLTLGPNTPQDVADWKAVRGTSYIYTGTITDAQASSYAAQGFEIALHPNTNCLDYTLSSLQSTYSTQFSQFKSYYSSIPAPVTSRNHCLVWSDWASTPKASLQNGIRLDATYYYWPEAWMQNRPGMFTGSGMPMRFADIDGTMIDVYQAATQMTDETNMNYTNFCNAVLDKAVGPEGYYGVFTANMHTDKNPSPGSDAIIASAQARQVPVISSKQMLTWLDARNNSYFSNMTWNGNQLSFTILARSTALNLKAMLPYYSADGELLSITMDGAPVAFTTQTIKGIQYAFFPSAIGIHEYVATYSNPAARTVNTSTEEITVGETAKTNTAQSATMESEPLGDKLYVNVMPNPGSGVFNVVITSNDPTPVTVKVVNMFGQLVEKQEKVASTGILRIGDSWKGGTYFAEIIQGNQRQVVKIIKLN